MKLSRRTFLAAAVALPAAQPVRVQETSGAKVTIEHGGRLFFEYLYSSSLPKPSVHPLCDPEGRVLTLNSPDDHVHHRGLMLGWTNIEGFDFWGETTPGRKGRTRQKGQPKLLRGRGGLSAENEWVDADERILLTETRTLTSKRLAADAMALDWESVLRPALDRITLTADKGGYDGLGVRFAREMNDGAVLNARGTSEISKANGQPAEWCCYWSGERGIAMFDHPSNPRYPTPFFVMNSKFGYLTAAPTFSDPLPVARGKPLRLRYRVVAFSGKPSVERFNTLFAEWKGR